MGRGLVSQDSMAEEGPWIPGERHVGDICLFHLHTSTAFSWQPEMWQKCLDCINELMDILFALIQDAISMVTAMSSYQVCLHAPLNIRSTLACTL